MTPTTATEPITIYDDVLSKVNSEAPFAPQAPGEKDDTYLRRLAGQASSLQDHNWKALQVSTQDWYNEVAKAINGMQPLPHPEGFVSAYVGPVEVATAVATPTEATSTTGKQRAGKGLMHHAREVALAHLDWHSEQVGAHMQTEGWDVPKTDSVWIATSEVKNVIKALDSIGMKIVPK